MSAPKIIKKHTPKNLLETPTEKETPNSAADPENEEKARQSVFHPEFEKDEIKKVLGLEDELKKGVIGQDHACESIAQAFIAAQAQDTDRTKPVESFMLNGPTGVGKTEIAKQLSKVMDRPLVRIDMSEYSESHSVSRLVGSPPGYVGHSQGGQLTNAILEQPDAIILLDEIEKAHPKTHKMFLQVMDDGILTDTQGNTVDFSNAVLLMTGNIGVTEAQKAPMGFNQSVDSAATYKSEVESVFPPEFINRLNGVIQFNPLAPEMMDKILDKMIGVLNEKYQHTTIALNEDARADIAKRGFDPMMGARPLARLLNKEIEQPIAKEILLQKLDDKVVTKINVSFNEAANDNADAPAASLAFDYVTEDRSVIDAKVDEEHHAQQQANDSNPPANLHMTLEQG